MVVEMFREENGCKVFTSIITLLALTEFLSYLRNVYLKGQPSKLIKSILENLAVSSCLWISS